MSKLNPDNTPETTATEQWTTMPLSAIRPGKHNPRRHADRIEEIAVSIENDGLFHNLLVAPVKGRSTYETLDGGRRYDALKLLQKRGALPQGWTDWEAVPVVIRIDASALDRKRLGVVANVQREDLHPLDEADAWAELLESGVEVADLSAQVGLTVKTIKRRLSLHGLCDVARNAYREGDLSLSRAQALALGTTEQQQELLGRMAEGCFWYDDEEIRDILLSDRPTASIALFPVEDYTGNLTEDWFSDEDSTYFDDAAQFMRLQRQAVEKLAAKYAENGAAFVDIDENLHPTWWEYEKARKNSKKAGVVISFGPNGHVEVREGLRKRDLTPQTTKQLEQVDASRPKPPRPAYGATLCRDIRRHKSLALQAALLANPRKAREVAVVQLISGYFGLDKMRPHDCLSTTEAADKAPDTYRVVDATARRLLTALQDGQPPDEDSPAWSRLLHGWAYNGKDLYAQVQRLSDDDLETLHLLLPVLAFGQLTGERLETEASLFNLVAQDLAVDMRQHWRPDETFLSHRTKKQLMELAEESGAMVAVAPLPDKKNALVTTLARYFAGDDETARTWLPGAMAFPAVDPGAPNDPADEEPHNPEVDPFDHQTDDEDDPQDDPFDHQPEDTGAGGEPDTPPDYEEVVEVDPDDADALVDEGINVAA